MRRHRIDPDETDIPGGWPRPYYVETRPGPTGRPPTGRPKYVQWSSGTARDQIFVCHDDRTYNAGLRFACSSCAHVMTRGLLLVTGPRNPYDSNVGSPICYRCTVFAFTHCPDFADHPDRRFYVVTGPDDYTEVDESGCLVPTALGLTRPVTDKAGVLAEVRAGRLHLTDVDISRGPLLTRPAAVGG